MPTTPRAGRARRYALLGALYVAQAVPLGFFIEAVPAIGRQYGLSLQQIGLIQALSLPFMAKFLWAPLVDGYGSSRRGHYRSWLIPLQLSAVVAVLIASQLDVTTQLTPLLAIAGVFMIVAATQDIATDGLAVRCLTFDERGTGNGIQVGGYYLGQILGGGVMLIVFEQFGWRAAMLAMAALLVPPLFVLSRFREAEAPAVRKPGVDFHSLVRFFRRRGTRAWVAVLLIYRAGDAMAMVMLKPLLVDLGWSLTSIGMLLGVGNASAAMTGALLGGRAIASLGRRRCLILFPLLQGTALAALAFISPLAESTASIWILSMAAAWTGGMATSALYTSMMDRSRSTTAGTDFTVQQSLAVVGPLVAAALSGSSAAALGYAGHFAAAGGLAVASATLVAWWLRPIEPAESVVDLHG